MTKVEKSGGVSASVEVTVDPKTAFKIFTEEINEWWERGPHNFYDGGRAVAKRFEPGVGGRYLEVYDDSKGDVLEIGRITVWDPGQRLVWRMSLDDTEVELRFDAIPGGTRVTVEQRLVPGGTKAHFYSGLHNILAWFADFADKQPVAGSARKDLPRICPILYYKDPATAQKWLVSVFGLQPRHRGDQVGELMLGDSLLMLGTLEGARPESPLTHGVYAYVDDLETHFAQARDNGAKIVEGVKKHGDRFYVAEDLEGHRWTFAQARPTQHLA
jgi:uncharacterized glyoxalase superfamily protein PhnB